MRLEIDKAAAANVQQVFEMVECGDEVTITRLGIPVCVIVSPAAHAEAEELRKLAASASLASIEGALDDIGSDLSALRHEVRQLRQPKVGAKA